jgi:Domain of unknown function (DUF4129)
MRWLAVALTVVALLVGAAGAAGASADEVTSAQLRALATRAEHDPGARARLARIDRVDGQPVDISGALAGAQGSALAARLRTLSHAGSGRVDAVAVRREARTVLGQGRFHEQTLPRPLHGVLAWLGRRLQPLGEPFDWLANKLGGAGFLLTILGAAVALVAGVFAFLTARRRAAAELLYFPDLADGGGPANPAELARLADQRERDGDYEGAVRLRFRAGLLLLDRARAIRYRASLTTAELSHALRSDDFDGVAHDFDEIVYGGRAAVEDDARAAREGWQRVLDRARGRSAR